MGMFDTIDWSDPRVSSYFGALQGLGAAAAPTRTPTAIGSAFGSMYGGAAQGAKDALTYQQAQQATQGGAIDLALKKAIMLPFLAQMGMGQNGQQTGQPITPPQNSPSPQPSASSGVPNGAAGSSTFGDYYDKFLKGEEGGYTPNDGNGKPANFGINRAANPDVDVSKLTPDQAKQIAYQRYWKPSGAEYMTPQLAAVQADTAFNMGPQVAWQLLAQSGGDPQKYLALRAQRYQAIAAANPAKAKDLPDWLKRNGDLAKYVSGFTPQDGNPQPASQPGNAAGGGPQNMTGVGASLAMRQLFGGKDRFQTMRNGWAYDNWTNSWQHFPDLGTGVTGEMGPDGKVHATVAEGELPALTAVGSAEAGGKAQFTPMTVYDKAGNEYTVPASVLGNPSQAAAPTPGPTAATAAPSAPGAPGTTAPTAAPAGTVAPAAQQPKAAAPAPEITPAAAPLPPAATPNTPVQHSQLGIPIKLDDFLSQLGPNYAPPSLPEGPPGSLRGAPGAGLAEIQKLDADRLEKYSNEASGGQKVYTNLQQLYQILGRGFSTGKMTEAASALANFAQQAGYSNLVPKRFDPSDAGAFNKLATDLVFAQLKQIGGRPMVSEIEGLRQANPNTSMTPAANLEVLTNILADQRWRDARADLGRQYMTRFGSLGDFDARFNQVYPQVDAYNKVAAAAQSSGWQLPGSPGATGAAQSPPKLDQSLITPANLKATALRKGMTVEQVKAELRKRGVQVP